MIASTHAMIAASVIVLVSLLLYFKENISDLIFGKPAFEKMKEAFRKAEKKDFTVAVNELFDEFDSKKKDLKLDEEELKEAFPERKDMMKVLKAADLNHDGRVSKGEFDRLAKRCRKFILWAEKNDFDVDEWFMKVFKF